MSRLQSILTGIATAIALVLVLVSIDFGKLAPSLHQLRTAPVVFAAIHSRFTQSRADGSADYGRIK